MKNNQNEKLKDGRSLRKRPASSRQFNMRITQELYKNILQTAQAEKIQMKEVLEKSFIKYLEEKENKNHVNNK